MFFTHSNSLAAIQKQKSNSLSIRSCILISSSSVVAVVVKKIANCISKKMQQLLVFEAGCGNFHLKKLRNPGIIFLKKLLHLVIENCILTYWTRSHMSHEIIFFKFYLCKIQVNHIQSAASEIQSKMNFYKAHFINDWLQSCYKISSLRNIFLRRCIFKINPSWSRERECFVRIESTVIWRY